MKSAPAMCKALSDLAKEGFGLATVNHYLTAIKMFTRWLVKDRRTADNRLGAPVKARMPRRTANTSGVP